MIDVTNEKEEQFAETMPEQPEQTEQEESNPTDVEETADSTAESSDMTKEIETLQSNLKEREDKYLRLAAEYENYRRRSAKEKEAIWVDAKGEAAAAFLPVYDNLERALKQETSDTDYKKGVEMTMNQLKTILEKLGITEIDALGQTFDPKLHNAVMHVEDDTLGENVVAEVFQTGFKLGEKVIRFAMVKVAN